MADKATRTDREILDLTSNIFKQIQTPQRTVLESGWFQSILYYLGEQWLKWFATNGVFGRRYEVNVNVPTPVSNIIRDYVRSLKANLLNKQYTTSIWPNSSEQSDKDGAMLGVYLLKDLDSENDYEIEDVKEMTALWWLLTGNGFIRVFPSNDDGQYVLGADGLPVVNKGCIGVDPVIPFNVEVPNLGTTLNQKAWVAIKDLRYREEIEDTYKVKLTAGESDMEVEYQKQLLTMISNVSHWKGRSWGQQLSEKPSDDYVLIKEIEYKPTPKYPQGGYAVVCCGQVLVNNPYLPIKPDKETGEWEYTLTHFSYNLVPGSFWATGAVDDLLSPQNTINKIDQALAMNRQSFGQPILLSPAKVTLRRISSKGQGVLAVEYDGTETMGAKPAVQAGVPYPNQILQERIIQREVAQTGAGSPKDVLKGAAPSGSSGILFDIMRETAEQSHGPDVKRFYRAWNRVNRKRLLVAQTVITEKRLLKIRGTGNDIEVKQFKAADLHGNLDVRLELDSGLSSTNVGKNQFLLDLIKAEFWGPINEQPQIQREVLKRMGMSGFPQPENLHRERAEYENALIADKKFKSIAFMGIPDVTTAYLDPQTGEEMYESYIIEPSTDPVFRIDDDIVHMQVHEQLILSREFEELDDKCQAVAVGHYVMHKEKWMASEAERLAQESQENISGNQGESNFNIGETAGSPSGI